MTLAVLAGMLPILPARAAPSITFLNPSGYAATKELSTVSDTDSAVHLVAWVGQVPANPIVEFELQATSQNAETIPASRVGSSDTWEAFFEIPANDTDGPYTLRARLYSNGNEVDNYETTVTINRSDVPPPTAAETVEITSPANGSGLGFFTPKGKATNTVIVVKASDGTEQVRGFYTQSDPGDDPAWKECGDATPGSTGVARIKCELPNDVAPSSISAVAAVANRTPPPAAPNAGLDDTGDAHRIMPYVQQPTRFVLSPQAQSVQPNDCTPATTATLLDQNGEPIAGANVDLHAVGPSDQLRFGVITNETSGFQDPDKNHISREFAINCSDESNSTIHQADHNIPGGDDIKHVESTGGTGNAGQFAFALHADEVGGTIVTIWADVDDDDQQQSTEAAGGARIGWGQAPPPPQDVIALSPASAAPAQGNCQKVTMTLTEDGTPLGGRNVDLHATGPSTLQFCDAGTGLPRPPDQGDHTGYSHPDGTIHGEGETDSTGHLSFGLTSDATGTTSLVAWMDKTDDDVQGTDEPSSTGQLSWKEAGHRTITIASNKSPVQRGAKVRLSGRIKGDSNCLAAQVVKLQARRHGGGSFKGAGKTTTGSEGRYSFTKRVKHSTDYRAVAPKDGFCVKATSRAATVKTG